MAPTPPEAGLQGFPRALAQTLVTAALYAALGWFASVLVLPSGYAAPFWPAAGLALGLVIVWGPAALPGIFIGSFVANALFIGDPDILLADPANALIPLGIGLGATAQAWAGRMLVLWRTGAPWRLDRSAQILALIGLGGPLACLISATIGQAALLQGGVIGEEQVALDWLTWWVGDSIGVALIAPLTLLVLRIRGPRQLDRLRRTVLMMALLVVAIVYLITVTVSWERQRLERELERLRHESIELVSANFRTYENITRAMDAFFESSPEVSWDEFLAFTAGLGDSDGLLAFEWLPEITHEQRPEVERQMREIYGHELGIVGEIAGRRTARASDRERYVPIVYVTPVVGNEPIIGLDVLTVRGRPDSLRDAAEEGVSATTDLIDLLQVEGKDSGIILLRAVHRDGELAGYVQLVLDLLPLLRRTVERADSISAELRLDPGQTDARRYRVTRDGLLPLSQRLTEDDMWSTAQIHIGDRSWELTFLLPGHVIQQQVRGAMWWVLLLALAISIAVTTAVLLTTGHQVLVEREVLDRTRALQDAHRRLEELSLEDGLTGLANRRCFDQRLEEEWLRSGRSGEPLTLALVDLDHFKALNDTHGHAVGDRCLKRLAEVLEDNLRRAPDMAARYGGDEFALLLPGGRPEQIQVVLLRLVQAARAASFDVLSSEEEHEDTSRVGFTISVGAATLVGDGDRAACQRLFEAADGALYEAKSQGRDRVVHVT